MKLYLDTNVLRDCLKRRKLETLRLLEIIREKKLECVTSVFSLMELTDTEKDDFFFNNHLKKGLEVSKILRQRSEKNLKLEDLGDIWNGVNNLFIAYPFVQFVNLIEVGWNMALEICRICNLDADDSIHLASAIGSGCDTFVTSDGFLKKEGKTLIKIHNDSVSEPEKKVLLNIVTSQEALDLMDKLLPCESNSEDYAEEKDDKEINEGSKTS